MGKTVLKIEVACPRCGCITRWSERALAHGKGRYCSRPCYEATRAATFVAITCARCGRVRTVRDIYVRRGQYKFCSDECRAIATPEERTYTCQTCGREFVAWHRKRRLHCSLECRRRQAEGPCANCGRPVKGQRARFERSEHVYCDMRCYRLHRMPRAQKALVDAIDALGVSCVAEHPIGRYLVDIYVPHLHLAVEVDGDYWHELPRQRAKDKLRDAFLRDRGLRVVHVDAKATLSNPSVVAKEVVDAGQP